MESYDDFFRNAKVYTQVHARPTHTQQKIIEQHLAQHYKANKEEQKQQEQSQNDAPHFVTGFCQSKGHENDSV